MAKPRLPGDHKFLVWYPNPTGAEESFPGCDLTGPDILDFLKAVDARRRRLGGRPLELIEGYRIAVALGWKKDVP